MHGLHKEAERRPYQGPVVSTTEGAVGVVADPANVVGGVAAEGGEEIIMVVFSGKGAGLMIAVQKFLGHYHLLPRLLLELQVSMGMALCMLHHSRL